MTIEPAVLGVVVVCVAPLLSVVFTVRSPVSYFVAVQPMPHSPTPGDSVRALRNVPPVMQPPTLSSRPVAIAHFTTCCLACIVRSSRVNGTLARRKRPGQAHGRGKSDALHRCCRHGAWWFSTRPSCCGAVRSLRPKWPYGALAKAISPVWSARRLVSWP